MYRYVCMGSVDQPQALADIIADKTVRTRNKVTALTECNNVVTARTGDKRRYAEITNKTTLLTY